jgi:hypothetical protein
MQWLEPALMPVLVSRELSVPIGAGVSEERLAIYLAQVERPLRSLLARERTTQVGPGLFHYRSRPFQLLHLQLEPSLNLAVHWQQRQLRIETQDCTVAGLPDWCRSPGFQLQATIIPARGELRGWTELGLHTRLLEQQGVRTLARAALQAALDRIERRLRRGLHRDLLVWLESEGVATG